MCSQQLQTINMSGTREMYRRLQAARKGKPKTRSGTAGRGPTLQSKSYSTLHSNYQPPSLPAAGEARRRCHSLGDALHAENPTTKRSLHDLEATEK